MTLVRKTPPGRYASDLPTGGRAAFKLFIGYNLQPSRLEGRTFERPGRAFS
jgi:hypothetical protein